MSNGIPAIGAKLSVKNNIAFKSSKVKSTSKYIDNIEKAYAKETDSFAKSNQDRNALYLLNPATPLENAKNRIQIALSALRLSK